MAILFEKWGVDTLQTSWKSSRQQMLVAIEGRHHDQKEKKKKKWFNPLSKAILFNWKTRLSFSLLMRIDVISIAAVAMMAAILRKWRGYLKLKPTFHAAT